MSLNDLSDLGQFISSLVVLASLIYLAVQVQQAKQNQRVIVQQGRAARLVDSMLQLSEESAADILTKVRADDGIATDQELVRFQLIFMALSYSMEDTYLHYRAGLIGEDEFQSFRARLTNQFTQIGFRTMWRRNRHWQSAVFRDFIDGIIRETPLAPADTQVAQWREDVAAERATATG